MKRKENAEQRHAGDGCEPLVIPHFGFQPHLMLSVNIFLLFYRHGILMPLD
jgi:hypothetical protein